MWKTTSKVTAIFMAALLALFSQITVADDVSTSFGVVAPQLKQNVSGVEEDLKCMAEALYYEARGESRMGQLAVGQVILNRVSHPLYPDSVCDVVYQKTKTRGGTVVCQFSWVCKQTAKEPDTDSPLWQKMLKTAYVLVTGQATAPVGRAVNFHSTNVSPTWAKYERREAVIGNHVFYR